MTLAPQTHVPFPRCSSGQIVNDAAIGTNDRVEHRDRSCWLKGPGWQRYDHR